MKKLIYLLIIAFGLAACNNGQKQINNGDVAQAKLKGCCAKKEMKMKKYTNADFYVDGKLSAEKTLAAYRKCLNITTIRLISGCLITCL